jgi:hypothetical protein
VPGLQQYALSDEPPIGKEYRMKAALAIISGLTGAVIAIESLILFVGVRLTANADELWLCAKNDLLVVLDVIAGAALIYFAFAFQKMPTAHVAIIYVLIVASICSHGYREWEYLVGADTRFFFNLPLFVFNNLRLLGLIATAALAMLHARNP